MSRLPMPGLRRPQLPILRSPIVGSWVVSAVLLTVAGMVGAADAADFKSIGTAAAVLYDGPSAKGKKMFVAPRGMPVEVLATVNNWIKIRDQAGDVLWVDRAELASQRTVIVLSTATVRSSPLDSATIVFQAERGVVLDLTDAAPAAGWVRVKHRDGAVGFVRATDVWGV
jgi:SH3-like domain-containing protein